MTTYNVGDRVLYDPPTDEDWIYHEDVERFGPIPGTVATTVSDGFIVDLDDTPGACHVGRSIHLNKYAPPERAITLLEPAHDYWNTFPEQKDESKL